MNLLLVLYAPPKHHAEYLRELEQKGVQAIPQRRGSPLPALRRFEIRRRVRAAA
jgi:hypothetical protein